jgi:hypothetical protein
MSDTDYFVVVTVNDVTHTYDDTNTDSFSWTTERVTVANGRLAGAPALTVSLEASGADAEQMGKHLQGLSQSFGDMTLITGDREYRCRMTTGMSLTLTSDDQPIEVNCELLSEGSIDTEKLG